MNDRNQFFGGLTRDRAIRLIDHTIPDMVFDHLGDEAVQRAATCGGLMENGDTAGPLFDRAPYPLDLATYAIQAFQQLHFFLIQMPNTP